MSHNVRNIYTTTMTSGRGSRRTAWLVDGGVWLSLIGGRKVYSSGAPDHLAINPSLTSELTIDAIDPGPILSPAANAM